MNRRILVVSISGGKDSTAAALLALDEAADERRFVFCDTGNEHPLTYEYVYQYLPSRLGVAVETLRADFTAAIARKRLFIARDMRHGRDDRGRRVRWTNKAKRRALAVLKPTGNPFLDLCLMKGRFPSRKTAFCTQELKRYLLDAYTLNLLGEGVSVESWRGIRREESENRKDARDREMAAEGWMVVHPIVDWTAQETVDYVLSRGVELNPLYRLGMGRVGCMPCINASKGELAEIARRFPDEIARIREWERLVSAASKAGFTTFFGDARLAGERDSDTARRLQIDARVLWAQTDHGGKQFSLLKTMPPPACMSTYGLCE